MDAFNRRCRKKGAKKGDGALFYGTTYSGGAAGWGTVFAINTNGTGHTILRNLSGTGAAPRASLVLNGSTLYGITASGGSGNGVVFSLNTDGTGFTIQKALSAADGAAGYSGLALQGSTLYGTTANGGQLQAGSVFGLTIPPRWTYSGPAGGAQAPFSGMLSGVVGSSVIIEASEDFSHWLPLQTNVLGPEGLSFTDSDSPGLPGRFYRAVALP